MIKDQSNLINSTEIYQHLTLKVPMETNETGSYILHDCANLTQEKDPTPNFYAIIPSYVRYCKSIPHGAILLFGELTALCNMKGYCWARNSYFAKLYDVDISTIKRWIHGLVENQFIHVEIENGEKGSSRKIWIRDAMGGGLKNEPVAQKRATPPSSLMHPPQLKNEPHNNTSNNTAISSNEDIACGVPQLGVDRSKYDLGVGKNMTPQKKDNTKERLTKEKYTKSAKPTSVASADAERLASLLFNSIKKVKDNFAAAESLKQWTKEIEKMLHENRSPEEIEEIIIWLPTNEFWFKNILSAKKLRLQFDRLQLEMKTKIKCPSVMKGQELYEHLLKHLKNGQDNGVYEINITPQALSVSALVRQFYREISLFENEALGKIEGLLIHCRFSIPWKK